MQLPEAIQASGWTCFPADTPEEAEALHQRERFRVGVISLGPQGLTRDWHDLLLSMRHVRWIASLPRECLSVGAVVDAICDHCYDFHVLPLDPQRLVYCLGHAWGIAGLGAESPGDGCAGPMVGSSPAMKRLFRLIPRYARSRAPVLIQGESGTGKELAAQAIHDASGQADGPFVAVNCGALPASLIHSELFGHERGAFTGASSRRIGRLEAADGGTLFLDEIGDLPMDLQVNLLRFLQEGTFERLGATRQVRPRVRVIAATYVDLEDSIARNSFREDLYYRLNVLRLELPPLRDRADDVLSLAQHFLQEFAGEGRGRAKGFSRHAIEAMQVHNWPGNVRELMNRVRRAAVLSDHALITPRDLGLERRRQIHRTVDCLAVVRQEAERVAIRNALARYTHNYSLAAQALGVSRATLYRMIRRHGLEVR
ncbi:DNA-binding transcriptional response regulator, NtrC family, contains REC, AAA-type ATPase, and a Fis-type DNA-binding domains [Aquisalimonas asiatica]|uniref:DNA-binding transcriptional response regulator, NtrC family, contains REC, AAA-type ATPase, and a Fis-type DNA-binding domains n=1 Tax=Aquisalimonas asiatica TaxID=406100 RepID=A0A1H8VJR3_9GAMM|nr:DNA-binding transcriptional response regulator, NtrC family, contains REC, AAA-type ATPase, and a Fis-type DNA-binding domains [Aquisalimonas asiatica]